MVKEASSLTVGKLDGGKQEQQQVKVCSCIHKHVCDGKKSCLSRHIDHETHWRPSFRQNGSP